MKQIIVPTDFSKGAWNALLYAADLGEMLGIREMIILNSYEAPHASAATLGSIDRVMQRDSEKGLDKWIRKIKEAGISARFNFHEKSVHTGLVEAINSQIEDYNDTLVVMGSLGETGMVEKLFGSKASDVALRVHSPVLVIPPKANFSKYKNIVLGSDFDHIAEKNLKILRKIYSPDPASNFQVVHVQGEHDEPGKASMGLQQDDIPHSITEISGDDVGEALDQYVSKSVADLLIVFRKENGFFGKFFHISVTKKLTLLGHVPLLVLKRDP